MNSLAAAEQKPEGIGESDAFLACMEKLSRVAGIDRPVLITGERGTGKEFAARRLHYLSRRWQRPLISLNCAALAPALLETELFGHEAGAFTGAGKRRTGRFEAAHTGTLFLDEIATMPLTAQEKILRVVEYGTLERVGTTETIHVDVRIIGATHSDLAHRTQQGTFRRDLLDRLSFEVLTLPPLRARQEDITLLATHFATRMAVEMQVDTPPVFSATALRQLHAYPWPGNIRELKNVVERTVFRAGSATVYEVAFDPFESPYRIAHSPSSGPANLSPQDKEKGHRLMQEVPSLSSLPTLPALSSLPALPVSLYTYRKELEQALLEKAMQQAGHNQKLAASLLDLSYDQFRGLYRKYQLASSSQDPALST